MQQQQCEDLAVLQALTCLDQTHIIYILAVNEFNAYLVGCYVHSKGRTKETILVLQSYLRL